MSWIHDQYRESYFYWLNREVETMKVRPQIQEAWILVQQGVFRLYFATPHIPIDYSKFECVSESDVLRAMDLVMKYFDVPEPTGDYRAKIMQVWEDSGHGSWNYNQ